MIADTKNVVPLLKVRGLCKYFSIETKGLFKKHVREVRACDDVSFDLMPGETLGLVGESGCGKTTTGRAILRAHTPTKGEVLFRVASNADSEESATRYSLPATRYSPRATRYLDLAQLPERDLKPLRTQMQMIFQDPFASLNPRMTVRDIVGEPLQIHGLAKGSEREDRIADILSKVGLKPEHRTRYPHAFSGGQRQRIGIARALIMHPKLVVCDEAVSALDVSVQAQVINLLQDLQQEMGLTTIFIAHDLSVVKHICDRIAVMYAGKIVELAKTDDLFANPLHPYTKALLASVPNPDPDQAMNFGLKGEVADPGDLPAGCSFHPRCDMVQPDCRCSAPEWREVEPGRFARCPEAYCRESLTA